MTRSKASRSSGVTSIELPIVAVGCAQLDMHELAVVRQRSLPEFVSSLPPNLLKHSDEQTLASLVALQRAIAQPCLAGEDYSQWGIVSSSRFLGRAAFAAVMDRYRADGPWRVSVQVIPHRTPHAVSGTMSLALHSHGPSLGAGGGIDDDGQAVLTLASLLRPGGCPGAWAAFSAWSPEPSVERDQPLTTASLCHAVVLAIVNRPIARSLGRLRIGPPAQEELAAGEVSKPMPEAGLVHHMLTPGARKGDWSCRPARDLRIELSLDDWQAHLVRPSSDARTSHVTDAA
jgi:hypothetical protein